MSDCPHCKQDLEAEDYLAKTQHLARERAAEIKRLRADIADMRSIDQAGIPWALERDLRAEIERLRAALKPFADLAGKLDGAPNLIGLLTEADFKRAARAILDSAIQYGPSPEKSPPDHHFPVDNGDRS